MSLDREDAYNECYSYITAIVMLDFLEDYWKYDMPAQVVAEIKKWCINSIQSFEKEHYGRVLE